MIKMTNVCPYCGEEWWEKHECEGTIAEAIRNERISLSLGFVEALLATHSEQEESQGIWDNFASWGDNPDESSSVNHPKHYNSHPSGVECIDVIKHYNFQIGNAMKYLWRQGLKDEKGLDVVEKQIEDCEKAIWYIQSFIGDLKKGN